MTICDATPSNDGTRFQTFGCAMPAPRTDTLNIKTLTRYFQDSWSLYERLFACLAAPSALHFQPNPLRHPHLFYLGHTAAFYVNKLCAAGALRCRIDPKLEDQFAVGVDPCSAAELSASEWPDAEQVWRFRRRVFELVMEQIEGLGERVSTAFNRKNFCYEADSVVWTILMAIEHERLHWETSSVLIRQTPETMLASDSPWPLGTTEQACPDRTWREFAGGELSIGKPRSVATFGWDNEYGQLKTSVAPFRVTRNLVTNREYWDFVASGGYANPKCWSSTGWDWQVNSGLTGPEFWRGDKGGWRLRTMLSEVDMPWDWPVEVNHFQAEAYCRWRGEAVRLPTEREHRWLLHLANLPQHDDINLDRGDWNLHLRLGSPSAVGAVGARQPVNDLCGNVWQLLSDDFYPLPGFKPHAAYADFSWPYFGEDHGMLLGGSWATTGTAASPYYRLWFRRSFAQHAGFRLAQSLETP